MSIDSILHSEVFALSITVAAFVFAQWLQKKIPFPLLHPLIVSLALIISLLTCLDIPYEVYQHGSRFIHFLLGPTVVALGVVLYEQLKYLKGNLIAILVSITVGATVGILSVLFLGDWMGVDKQLIVSIAPKSITTPIAIATCERAGGIPSLTAVSVAIVGIGGSILGPYVLNLIGIRGRIARGLAMGAASHGIGTAAAFRMGAVEGAISGLAIGLMGVVTAILLPLFV